MISEILLNLNFFNFYTNWNLEDALIVFLLYNFFKYIIIGAIVELIWPTQFFNRKNTISFNSIRHRTYTETVLKLRNYSKFHSVFIFTTITYLFIVS